MKTFLFILFCMWSGMLHAESITVNVGDIIDIDGHKAIVFTVDNSGEHGKAMYVKAFRGVDEPWCNSGKHAKRLLSLTNTDNGYKNTAVVIKYANDHNILSSFPVFNWCISLGPMWYIPSIMELECFINFWLGNEEILNWEDDSKVEISSDKPYFKEINQRLLDAGGIPFINGVYTSTVDSDGKVYVFYYDSRKNTWTLKKRNVTSLGQDCVGRAFVNF